MAKEKNTNKDIFDQILEQKLAFFCVFMVVITVTYGVLFAIDFIPEPKTVSENETEIEEKNIESEADILIDATKALEESFQEARAMLDPLPVRIIFDSLERDVVVLNPESTKIADLDAALLKGVVRHPDSADFQDNGNMFLFGHSSYLPTVHNKNFQAFNGIQKLMWGDMIRVQSSDAEYLYRVKKVYQTKASEATVTIDNSKPKLTLATCNSFGSKDDRYIVEAELIDSYPL